MHRANIDDGMNAKEYYMRGINANTSAAIEEKSARSVQNLLVYAIGEQIKIKWLQQDKISRCINLCKDITTRLHADLKPKMPFFVGSKRASSQCKKKGSFISECESIDAFC